MTDQSRGLVVATGNGESPSARWQCPRLVRQSRVAKALRLRLAELLSEGENRMLEAHFQQALGNGALSKGAQRQVDDVYLSMGSEP